MGEFRDLVVPEVVGEDGLVRGRGRGKYREVVVPELRMVGKAGRRRKLTARNLEVWTYYAAGYKPKQIAELYGMSLRSVNSHLEVCRKLLGKKPDLERMRRGLLALYPEAMRAMRKNLEEGEPKVTVQWFKLSGVAAPKQVDSRVVRVNVDVARSDIVGGGGEEVRPLEVPVSSVVVEGGDGEGDE